MNICYVDCFEREKFTWAFRYILDEEGWSQAHTARVLGVDRATVWRLLEGSTPSVEVYTRILAVMHALGDLLDPPPFCRVQEES